MKEPGSYPIIFEALEESEEKYNQKILENGMDSHTQTKNAKFYAKRLMFFLENFMKKSNTKILDCGCGLGFIARELKKNKNFEVYYSDPAPSAKKIIDKLYPSSNFIPVGIENIPTKFENYFDIIYLREVYPFTRNNDIINQSSLIKILKKNIKKEGKLILEQIKNRADLFDNLNKLELNYKIFYLPPVKWINYKLFYKIYFKYNLLSFLMRLFYKLSNKKINHYIVIEKD